jgi:NAD(P)-dependent dehydrogenase (short-subunit alcohol dehydrogenase family)
MMTEWAVVAGASGTLGTAISTALREHELTVLGIARTDDPDHGIIGMDLTDPTAVDTIADHIDGPVRMIVHAAGSSLSGGIKDADVASVMTAVDVKVGGLLRLVRALDGLLFEGSRIVAITGNLGYDPIPSAVSAGVANAGLAALVRQLAAAYGPRQITSHAIAPGPVESPRVDRLITHVAASSGGTLEEARAGLVAGAPVGRFATPRDVAWAVESLLTDSASLMNGSTIFLDGGRRTAIP